MNRMVGLRINLGTVAIILSVCAATTVVLQADFVQEVELELTTDSFRGFFVRLHDNIEKYCVGMRHGHCVRPYTEDNKKKTAPKAWVRVGLYETTEFKAALYFRSDTLDLIAFANKDGYVYYMDGYNDLFADFTDVASLPFSENYGDLTGSSGNKDTSDLLMLVPLGRTAARAATDDLSNYDSSESKLTSVKRAILAFSIMVAGSLRFKPISARCNQYWEEGSRLTNTDAKMLLMWGVLSKQFYNKELDEAPATNCAAFMELICVQTIDDLGGILDCVLLPRPEEIEDADWGNSRFAPDPDLNPAIIHVAAAEDVNMKLSSFSRKGSRSIYILSARGVISNVKLHQPSSLGGTMTYQGRFELLSLSGHFTPTDRDGSRNCSGRMTVALAGPQGHILRGRVAGLLVAAGPVQVKVGRLLSRHHLDQNWTAKAPVPG